MKTVILDGSSLSSMEEVHETLARQLSFPVWYGRNLDALHDCLTVLQKKTELTVIYGSALSNALGPGYSSLCQVLRDCAEENPNLTVQL